MVNIKTIKIHKGVYTISICLLILMILFFMYKILSPMDTIAVLSQKGGIGIGEITNFNSTIKLERILISVLDHGLPYLGITNSQYIDRTPPGIFVSLFYFFTDINFEEPTSFITAQIPILSFYKAETTTTPGIELPPVDSLPDNSYRERVERDKGGEVGGHLTDNDDIRQELQIGNDPLVLIYHTHSTECYSPSVEETFKSKEISYHSKDLNITVVRVGEEMKRYLEERYGIKVVHDRTMNDIPSYMMSYTNSLNTFERNIKKYPSIKVAIDLHRDAPYVDRIRSRELTTIKIDGKDVARIMLVVGTDKLFHHPNWKKNYRFALKIQEKMEELYPGLGRQINIRDERFNQHLLDKSLLVEIGSHGNTLEEALRSARLFADVVAQVLKELSQKD